MKAKAIRRPAQETRQHVPASPKLETTAETMPPPTRSPKQKEGIDQTTVNEVFAKNLEEIVRWYRRRPPGPDLPSFVIMELTLRDMSHAWALALQGKNWQPSET